MIKINIFIFLLFTLFLFQNNKQKVTGFVVDRNTKEPLPGACITIAGSQDGAATDSNGNFILTLKPGKYILNVLYIGYKHLTDTIQVDNNNHNILRYELEPRKIEGTIERIFSLSKEDAEKDISQNNFRIFIYEFDDSVRTITDKIALKYGFNVYWPDNPILLLSVGEYNETVIKYLGKRYGEDWYPNFLKELNNILKTNKDSK